MTTQFSRDGNWKLEECTLYESVDGAWLYAFNCRGNKGVWDAVNQLREHIQNKSEEQLSERDLELAERYNW